jgi:hypothetical protein
VNPDRSACEAVTPPEPIVETIDSVDKAPNDRSPKCLRKIGDEPVSKPVQFRKDRISLGVAVATERRKDTGRRRSLAGVQTAGRTVDLIDRIEELVENDTFHRSLLAPATKILPRC